MSLMPTEKEEAIAAAVAEERADYQRLVEAAEKDLAARDAVIAALRMELDASKTLCRAALWALDTLAKVAIEKGHAGKGRDREREMMAATDRNKAGKATDIVHHAPDPGAVPIRPLCGQKRWGAIAEPVTCRRCLATIAAKSSTLPES